LQIVLAGQPELDQKLDSYELRQLKQRIALRCHLDQLTASETSEYMWRRLAIAGAPAAVEIFSRPAIEAVFLHSRGIPRLINTICENALLAGYAKHAATITSEIIEGVARDLRLSVVAEPKGKSGIRLPQDQEQNELLLAMKTLLDAHDRIKGADPKGRLQ